MKKARAVLTTPSQTMIPQLEKETLDKPSTEYAKTEIVTDPFDNLYQ
jgi:hypothetical protein